jgi:hypothetical protein
MSLDQENADSITSLAKRLVEELQRAKDNMGRSADAASEQLAAELRQLRDDLAAVQHTISAFAPAAHPDARQASVRMRTAGAEAIGEFAANASKRVHSTIADFEQSMRRNPQQCWPVRSASARLWVCSCENDNDTEISMLSIVVRLVGGLIDLR